MSKRVYISGQMSGLDRAEYLARFDRAAELLRQEGYDVVNPARLLPSRWPWLYRVMGYNLTLLYDLWKLSKCDLIYKIPGWKDSRGANIESCWAYHNSIGIIMPKLRNKLDLKMAKFIDKAGVRETERMRKIFLGAHLGPMDCEPSRPISEWMKEFEEERNKKTKSNEKRQRPT